MPKMSKKERAAMQAAQEQAAAQAARAAMAAMAQDGATQHGTHTRGALAPPSLRPLPGCPLARPCSPAP